MKVILLNGSPNEKGNTYLALAEVAGAIEKEGIETETIWIGKEPIRGCQSCYRCTKRGGSCVFEGDIVNEFIEKAKTADGFVFGSPVYWASPNGSLLAMLDRVFFAGGGFFGGKPGAAVVSARRAGTSAALDALNKYFPINGMPIVASQYWTMVHGAKPGEAVGDTEGMQTMRLLGANMAWMLKCFEAGKAAGIEKPVLEDREWTNFIR